MTVYIYIYRWTLILILICQYYPFLLSCFCLVRLHQRTGETCTTVGLGLLRRMIVVVTPIPIHLILGIDGDKQMISESLIHTKSITKVAFVDDDP